MSSSVEDIKCSLFSQVVHTICCSSLDTVSDELMKAQESVILHEIPAIRDANLHLEGKHGTSIHACQTIALFKDTIVNEDHLLHRAKGCDHT